MKKYVDFIKQNWKDLLVIVGYEIITGIPALFVFLLVLFSIFYVFLHPDRVVQALSILLGLN